MSDFATLLKTARTRAAISFEALSEKTGIPVDVLRYLEGEQDALKNISVLLADAFAIPLPVFMGTEEMPKPKSKEEVLRETVATSAQYPNIRKYLLNDSRAPKNPEVLSLFAKEPFSLIEKNIVLFMSTSALYNFCSTDSSTFGFEEYLFKLHGKLLSIFEKEIAASSLSAEEKEERLANARSNIFGCDTMSNIAVRVLDPFAAELEGRLKNGDDQFLDDIDGPFTWKYDGDLSQISILGTSGEVKHTVKLLAVKPQ